MDCEIRKKKLLKKLSWINTQLLTASDIRYNHFIHAKTIINKRLKKLL